MTFDGFFTRRLVAELKSQLLNGKITKIYQPFEQELQIVVRSNRQNFRLASSIHSTYYHVHLTQERPSNPAHAPMFCMLLRKHLENAMILDIRQVENDRIIEFELTGRDEIGDTQHYVLIFELMGRHSNILLVNNTTHTIIDCIKHVPMSQNTYRSLQPGGLYIRPPQNPTQHNIWSLNSTELEQWVMQHYAPLTSGHGNRVIQGMSGLLANELAYRLAHSTKSPTTIVQQFLQDVDSVSPVLIEAKDKLFFYSMPLAHLMGTHTQYDSLSSLLADYFDQKIKLDRIKQVSGDLIQRLHQLIARHYKKLENLEADRQVASDADIYRIKGELLNIYPHRIEKGQTSVELENYYDNQNLLTIELDPRKTANENSQTYYKRYSKYRDALKYIDEQETQTTEEIDYLEGILVQLSQADIEDIGQIKLELIEQGYSSQRKNSEKKRAKAAFSPRHFVSSDGVNIWVGRNNTQNDELSLKKSSKNHWWLHTKDIPGAHVIIEDDNPSDDTITEAGEIAAYYSKYQHSSLVPVDLVRVKNLHKPNGAKPGFVIYEGQRTILVTPDEERIKAMMQ